MINVRFGNIFSSSSQALVNPVNCIGVMGAGLALAFKQKYPENYSLYRTACFEKRVKIGKMFTSVDSETKKTIVNFPTKIHWKDGSSISYIELGLTALIQEIREKNIQSIAIPMLGTGCGKLDKQKVKDLIIEKLKVLEDTDIELYTS